MNILELHQRFRRYCAIEEGLSSETIRSFASSITTFTNRTSVENIGDITPEILREFFYEGREKYQWSYASYVNHHKYFKKFFNWCIERGYLTMNPVLDIKRPKKPERLPRRLTHEEAQTVLYASFNHQWRYAFERTRNHAIIAVLLFAGLRAKELLNLQLMDVNLDAGVLLVRAGKGNKDRYVPIHHKLSYILKRYLTDRKRIGKQSPYLFTAVCRDGRLTYKALSKLCRKLSIETGIKFTAHCLRHTFGSVAIEQDMGLVQLKEIMGHSNILSTMIYLKMSPQGLKTSLDRIELF